VIASRPLPRTSALCSRFLECRRGRFAVRGQRPQRDLPRPRIRALSLRPLLEAAASTRNLIMGKAGTLALFIVPGAGRPREPFAAGDGASPWRCVGGWSLKHQGRQKPRANIAKLGSTERSRLSWSLHRKPASERKSPVRFEQVSIIFPAVRSPPGLAAGETRSGRNGGRAGARIGLSCWATHDEAFSGCKRTALELSGRASVSQAFNPYRGLKALSAGARQVGSARISRRCNQNMGGLA